MRANNKNSTKKKKAGWPNLVFPLLTVICLAGFVCSLLFPNSVLDTIGMNVQQEEGEVTVLLPLSYDSPILYSVDTQGRPMQGIQPGIHKRGWDQAGQRLRYQVLLGDQLVSDNVYDISQGFDLQYVYLPFANADACSGKLTIKLFLEGDTKEPVERCAALEANFTPVKDCETTVYEGIEIALSEEDTEAEDGDKTEDAATSDETEETEETPDAQELLESAKEQSRQTPYSLKGYHIYSHNTYPLLYDMRILTFLFLAVSMTLTFKGRRKGK